MRARLSTKDGKLRWVELDCKEAPKNLCIPLLMNKVVPPFNEKVGLSIPEPTRFGEQWFEYFATVHCQNDKSFVTYREV